MFRASIDGGKTFGGKVKLWNISAITGADSASNARKKVQRIPR